MAYSIKTTLGNPVATVQDGTVNTTAISLALIGRDYAGYGAFLNENFVYLLENFNSGSAPTNPLTGQLWYNTSTATLQVWNSTQTRWKSISGAIYGNTGELPASNISTVGDFYWNTDLTQLFVYSGNTLLGNNGWILIGPDNAVGSGAIVDSNFKDSTGTPHTVIKFLVNFNVIGIISYDPQFTPQSSVPGFTVINPGFNLSSSFTLTGTSTNSLALSGITAGQFLRSDYSTATQFQLGVGGLQVVNDLTLNLDTSNNRVRIGGLTNNRDLIISANVNGVTTTLIGIKTSTSTLTLGNTTGTVNINGTTTANGAFTAASTTTLQGVTTLQNTFLPYTNGNVDIGATATRFANVWATTLYGNLTSVTATVSGQLVASTVNSPFIGNSGAQLTGIIQTTSQPNITGVGTLANLITSGTFTQNGVTGGIVPIGGIIMWSGSPSSVPAGWLLCNGQTVNAYTTPNLEDKFIVGAGNVYPVGSTVLSANTSSSGSTIYALAYIVRVS